MSNQASTRAIAMMAALLALLLPLVMLVPSARAQEARTSCEGGRYPDNGDFEVAEIAERTPTIIELEYKQVSEDEPYAETGTVVVVWSRSGQYACVESPTGIPNTYFWVDQRSLKNIPDAAKGEDPWVGTYNGGTTVEIAHAADGRYDVYGEIDHTLGDGPGWG